MDRWSDRRGYIGTAFDTDQEYLYIYIYILREFGNVAFYTLHILWQNKPTSACLGWDMYVAFMCAPFICHVLIWFVIFEWIRKTTQQLVRAMLTGTATQLSQRALSISLPGYLGWIPGCFSTCRLMTDCLAGWLAGLAARITNNVNVIKPQPHYEIFNHI